LIVDDFVEKDYALKGSENHIESEIAWNTSIINKNIDKDSKTHQ